MEEYDSVTSNCFATIFLFINTLTIPETSNIYAT